MSTIKARIEAAQARLRLADEEAQAYFKARANAQVGAKAQSQPAQPVTPADTTARVEKKPTHTRTKDQFKDVADFEFEAQAKVSKTPQAVHELFSRLAQALGKPISDSRGDEAIDDILTKDDISYSLVLYRVVLAACYDQLRTAQFLGRKTFDPNFRFQVRQSVSGIVNRSCQEDYGRVKWSFQTTRRLIDEECERLARAYESVQKEERKTSAEEQTNTIGQTVQPNEPIVEVDVEDPVIEAEFTEEVSAQPVNSAVAQMLQEFLYGTHENGDLREGVILPETVNFFVQLKEPPTDADTDDLYRNWLYRQVMQRVGSWYQHVSSFLTSSNAELVLPKLNPAKRFVNSAHSPETILAAAQVMVAYNQPLEVGQEQIVREIAMAVERGDLNNTLELI